jgi:hypothetical protein
VCGLFSRTFPSRTGVPCARGGNPSSRAWLTPVRILSTFLIFATSTNVYTFGVAKQPPGNEFVFIVTEHRPVPALVWRTFKCRRLDRKHARVLAVELLKGRVVERPVEVSVGHEDHGLRFVQRLEEPQQRLLFNQLAVWQLQPVRSSAARSRRRSQLAVRTAARLASSASDA